MATTILAAPRTIPADVQHDILALAVLRSGIASCEPGLNGWPRESKEYAIVKAHAESLRSAAEHRRERIAARLIGMVKAVRP